MKMRYYIFIFLIAFIISFVISSYTKNHPNKVYINTHSTPKLVIKSPTPKEIIFEHSVIPTQSITNINNITDTKPLNKTSKSSNFFQDIIFIIIILLLSLLIFGIIYFIVPYIIKRFSHKVLDIEQKVIDTINISDNKTIQIVEEGNKILVYELVNNNRKFLTEIKDSNLINNLKNPMYKAKGSLFLTEYLKKFLLFPDNLNLDDYIKSHKIDYTINEDLTKHLSYDSPESKLPKIAPIPPKNLLSKLENAMGKFAQNNPNNDLAAKLVNKSKLDNSSNLPSYITQKENLKTNNTIVNNQITSILSKMIEQQNKRLELIKEQKYKIEKENKLISTALIKKQEIEHKLANIGNDLRNIDINSNEPINIKLNKILNTLEDLENETLKLITDTSLIQNLIKEKSNVSNLKNFFNSIPEIFEQIDSYNKQLIKIRQAREVIEREKERKQTLLKRKKELEESIYNIKTAIDQIEKINHEIQEIDPTSPIEPIPVTIINELKRLELELQAINADLSLKD